MGGRLGANGAWRRSLGGPWWAGAFGKHAILEGSKGSVGASLGYLWRVCSMKGFAHVRQGFVSGLRGLVPPSDARLLDALGRAAEKTPRHTHDIA